MLAVINFMLAANEATVWSKNEKSDLNQNKCTFLMFEIVRAFWFDPQGKWSSIETIAISIDYEMLKHLEAFA